MFRLRLRDAAIARTTQIPVSEDASLGEADAAFPLIDAYVAELSVGLRGVDSAASQASETCEEINLHLRASASAMIELGDTVEAAEIEALRRFGGMQAHRRALADELRRKARRADRTAAFRFALATYGGVCALDVLGAAFFLIVPRIDRYDWLLFYWQWYAMFWLILGSPLVTGWYVGRHAGALAEPATCRALLYVIGGLLLGSGLAYAVVASVNGFSGRDLMNADSPMQMFVNSLFGLACYHVVRFPLALFAAYSAGRRRRRPMPFAKG